MVRKEVNLVILTLVLMWSIAFAGANSVYVVPFSASANTGDNFQIRINATTSTSDLHSIQFDVNYDPAVLTLSSVSEGAFLSSDGRVTIFNYSSFGSGLADDIYNARNTTYADSSPGINGTGTIAILNFTAISVGSSNISLFNVTWVNSSILNASAAVIIPTINNGSVNVASVPCVLTNATWSATSVTEGQQVSLTVTGTNCDGQTLNFSVWEDDGIIDELLGNGDDNVTQNPSNVAFSGNTATATWNSAEWQNDCGGLCNPPEYYFISTLVTNSSTTINSKSVGNPMLTVDKLYNANEIFIQPDTQTVNLGQNFIVNVNGRAPVTASDVYGLEYNINYDSGILSVNSVTEGTMLNSYGAVTTFNYTLSSGKIHAYDVRNVTNGTANPGVYTDEGTFLIINFSAVSAGASGLNISDLIWVNSTITNMSVGIPGVTITNGSVGVNAGANNPPVISNIQCEINSAGNWQLCNTILYGSVVQQVRTNCTDSDGSVLSVNFTLHNTEDNSDLIFGVGNQNVNVWTYDIPNPDYTTTDSGGMTFTVACQDNAGAVTTNTSLWTILFGTLSSSLVYPTASVNVTQNQFFWFNSSVTCSGGECGNVNATLDPVFGKNIIGAPRGPATGNNSRCQQYILTETGVVKNISWYGRVDSGTGNCALAIYDSSGTLPNALMAQSLQYSVGSTNGWNTFTISPTTLSSGDYFICALCDASWWYSTDTSGTTAGKIDTYPFDNPFGAVPWSTSYNISFYASYDLSGSSKGVIPMNSGTPFYTTSQNPMDTCTNMKSGNSCTTSWSVNATGAVGTSYDFFVDYAATQYPVTASRTAIVNIGIDIQGTLDTPPSAVLHSPVEGFTSASALVTFNGSVSDDLEINNVSLYINDSLDQTNISGINNADYIFTQTFANGAYSWYYKVCDNSSQCTNSAVRTFNVNALTCTDTDTDTYYLEGLSCGTAADCNDTNPAVNPGATESDFTSTCDDGFDNNCNGECDYDSSHCSHGDSGCSVDLLSVQIPDPYTHFPVENTIFEVDCGMADSSLPEVNSIYATIGSAPCAFGDYGGFFYSFNCSSGDYTGINKTVTCYVNTSRSYSNTPTASLQVSVQPNCIDGDHDGYNATYAVPGVCGVVDCNDTNSSINPGAIEACNGVDDDCVGGIDNGLIVPLLTLQAGVCNGYNKTCMGVGGWVDNYAIVPNYQSPEATCDLLDNDCDDSVDETYSNCVGGTPYCVAGSCVECSVDGDCNDGVDCTINSCSSGTCVYTPDDGVCGADGVCGDHYCNALSGCQINYNSSLDQCRLSAGICDAAEFCTGSSDICPNDLFQPSSQVCRASAGICDLIEYCTGSSATCPSDDLKSTAVCRAATDACDAAESCDGFDNNCPADLKAPSGTLCGSVRDCPTSACNGFFAELFPADDHDRCDGGGNCNAYSCAMTNRYCSDNNPGDGVNLITCNAGCDQNSDCGSGFECNLVTCNCVESQCAGQPAGTPCDDGIYCNGDDQCDSSEICVNVGPNVLCNDLVSCTDDSCNEATDGCDYITNNSLCNNGQYCDGVETCISSGCQAGIPVDCMNTDSFSCTDDSCDEVADSCNIHIANDTLCNPGEICDILQFPAPTGCGVVCTDADHDFYSLEDGGNCCGPLNNAACNVGADCNDTNSLINPGATEVCNGIDDNCVGGIDEDGVCVPCTITSLSWGGNNVSEGDVVNLNVQGTNCDSQNVDFSVWEYDGLETILIFFSDDPTNTDPISVNFTGNTATTTWTAEWQDDGLLGVNGDPEYYFMANVGGVTGDSGKSDSELLHVSLSTQRWEARIIHLNAGKNSLSIPLILNNMSVADVFKDISSSADKIYTFDGTNGFEIYYFDGIRPSNLVNLEIGKGYFVFMNSSADLVINGTRRTATLERPTITLVPGWNLIGTFSNSYEASIILSNVPSYTQLYTYNGTAYIPVSSSDIMSGEKSYWIYVDNPESFVPVTGIVVGE